MTSFGILALLCIPHRMIPKLPPRPLGGGEIGGQFLTLTLNFSTRGAPLPSNFGLLESTY